MNHPDFRVGGRIFATLGYPGPDWAAVALTPALERRVQDLQHELGGKRTTEGHMLGIRARARNDPVQALRAE